MTELGIVARIDLHVLTGREGGGGGFGGVVLRGEDARRKVAVSEGGVVHRKPLAPRRQMG